MMNLKEKYLQLQMREYASITIIEEQLNPSRRCKGHVLYGEGQADVGLCPQ
jgi:hypothetical protein